MIRRLLASLLLISLLAQGAAAAAMLPMMKTAAAEVSTALPCHGEATAGPDSTAPAMDCCESGSCAAMLMCHAVLAVNAPSSWVFNDVHESSSRWSACAPPARLHSPALRPPIVL